MCVCVPVCGGDGGWSVCGWGVGVWMGVGVCGWVCRFSKFVHLEKAQQSWVLLSTYGIA